MKARETSELPLQHCLADFLFGYRSTPHSTTGRTPSSLFLGRELRTRLDILKPNCEDKVLTEQSHQVQQHDQHAKSRQFDVGQQVMARNYGPGSKWCPAVVKSRVGPLTVLVETDKSKIWKRHHDQLRPTKVTTDTPSDSTDEFLVFDHPIVTSDNCASPPIPPVPPRYPQRNRQPPQRYGIPVNV